MNWRWLRGPRAAAHGHRRRRRCRGAHSGRARRVRVATRRSALQLDLQVHSAEKAHARPRAHLLGSGRVQEFGRRGVSGTTGSGGRRAPRQVAARHGPRRRRGGTECRRQTRRCARRRSAPSSGACTPPVSPAETSGRQGAGGSGCSMHAACRDSAHIGADRTLTPAAAATARKASSSAWKRANTPGGTVRTVLTRACPPVRERRFCATRGGGSHVADELHAMCSEPPRPCPAGSHFQHPLRERCNTLRRRELEHARILIRLRGAREEKLRREAANGSA